MDEIAIIVVDYEHIGIASDGRLDEAASKVREDFAGVRGEIGIEEVEFVVGGFGVFVVDGVGRVVVVVVAILEGSEGVGVASLGVFGSGLADFGLVLRWLALVWSR